MSGFMPLMGSVRLLDKPSPLIAQNQAPGWNGGLRFPLMGQAPVQPVAPVSPQPVSPPAAQPVVQPVLAPAPVLVPAPPTVVTVTAPSYVPWVIGLGALALVTVIAVSAGK